MIRQGNIPDTFYNQFIQRKPTKIGIWLSQIECRKIFRYAGLTSEDSILEIGPGLGFFADVCLKEGAEYCALEPNRQMFLALEKKGIRVIRAIVPPLPDFGRMFDAVVMINFLEHMDTMQHALQLLQSVRMILKPKGKILICSPDYLNLRANFFNCDFSHNYVTTRLRIVQLLINADFEIIRSCYLSGPISGPPCILLSAFVSRLPFGLFNAFFPGNNFLYRLYRLQLAFSRKAMVIGGTRE